MKRGELASYGEGGGHVRRDQRDGAYYYAETLYSTEFAISEHSARLLVPHAFGQESQVVVSVAQLFDEKIMEAEEEDSLREEHDDWPSHGDLIAWYRSFRTDGLRELREAVMEELRARRL